MSKFRERAAQLSTVLHARAAEIVVQELPVADVIPDPENPRKVFDEAKLKAMARSVKRRGLLQPITVRPVNADGKYIIRFGERRWRAHQIAELETVRAIISDTAEERDNLVDQVVENEQRVDLTTSEMIEAVQKLLAEGLTKAEIAEELACQPADVSQYVALSEIDEHLRALIDKWPRRALYDLHIASRRFPAEVKRFVAERGDEAITTAMASAFVRDLKARAKVVPAPKPDTPQRAAAPAQPAGEASIAEPAEKASASVPDIVPSVPAKGKGKRTSVPPVPPVVTVTVDGKTGRLILPASVTVLFDGEAEPVTVPVHELRFQN
ncbi:MAG: ParB/RepB/Spo0J family partition protein [Novosphingobium sp.]